MKILVLNGPNLGRLGTRQTDVYGLTTYAELVTLCQEVEPEADVRQTDDEATLIGWLRPGEYWRAHPEWLSMAIDASLVSGE